MAQKKSTGFPPGRPRRGESRPMTKNNEATKRWYYENHERALELNREKKQRWNEAHPGRAKLHQKTYRDRVKAIGENWPLLKDIRFPASF